MEAPNGIYLSSPVATPNKILKGDQDGVFLEGGDWRIVRPMAYGITSEMLCVDSSACSGPLQLEEAGERNTKRADCPFLAVCEALLVCSRLQQSVISCHDKLLQPLSLPQNVLKLRSITYALIRMRFLNLLEALRHTCKIL